MKSRIISLVPSQTELLYHLGLEQEVVGITKFCVHPESWFRSKTRVGGTKQLHLDTIRQLRPDLILANKEENVKEQVETLAQEFPVYTSDVADLAGALEMIRALGALTGKAAEAGLLAQEIEKRFLQLRRSVRPLPLRTAYLIWRQPYMTVGGDTFINNMLRAAGLENLFGGRTRYPVTSVEELQALGCELLLLSSEPYPFKEQHRIELQALLPQARIELVDGELFSWYGSRLLLAPAYFGELHQKITAQ
ncbi:helical backbone metal receptor [Paraflavisolibacter sp. H34]|uniref:helical backbone metal receptor n=1 Tax=Huijunlia imazamoxiresistens TaxID=3127457 RepID=UPI00301A00E5